MFFNKYCVDVVNEFFLFVFPGHVVESGVETGDALWDGDCVPLGKELRDGFGKEARVVNDLFVYTGAYGVGLEDTTYLREVVGKDGDVGGSIVGDAVREREVVVETHVLHQAEAQRGTGGEGFELVGPKPSSEYNARGIGFGGSIEFHVFEEVAGTRNDEAAGGEKLEGVDELFDTATFVDSTLID